MKRILLIVVVAVLVIGAILGKLAWNKYLKPLVKEDMEFYIATGSDYESMKKDLSGVGLLIDEESFDAMATALQFEKVYAGKYKFEKGWSQWKLIKKLRSGTVETVRVTFQSVRHLEDLAAKVALKIEADSASLARAFHNQDLIDSAGGIGEIFCNMIPNTYEFYWNTSASQFVSKMVKESQKFWNEERLKKAAKLGLTPCEVITIASIVQEEQQIHKSEHPIIAGLYLNRVKQGKKLEADPTLKYLKGDFTIEPNNLHKLIKSPYNTYMYKGIPPGPIVLPEGGTIDATLNRADHEYVFMCAKEDFSGYHNFARTYQQHLVNANKYREANRARKKAAKNK